MKLVKKAQYALLFVIFLHNEKKASVKFASEILNLPKSFLEQIARNLRQSDIITVKKGPNGGYSLTDGRSPTVTEVLEAVGVYLTVDMEQRRENATRGITGQKLNIISDKSIILLRAMFNKTIASFTETVSNVTIGQANEEIR